ncbi:MAG: carboxypeptidase-like regulatory domain-containing protein [Prevotellaceae bacterium]|nr:carboxypeptidase-like regulatory domain-containing protein [Prevotellaceae bacterium]
MRTVTAFFLLIFAISAEAQFISGYVTDIDTGQPLKGAIVSVSGLDINAESDSIGFWSMHVSVGTYPVRFQLLGYEPVLVSGVSVSAGKQRVLSVSMKESMTVLGEVVVIPDTRSYGQISRLQVNPSELSHIPGNAGDPVRMLAAMPGITNTGDDRNDLVVRGNSAIGVLWRIEGVEVFNPNHYALSGTNGGTVSLLNRDIIGASSFYTGAFPAEFGNVFSGVFDLSFREGNAGKYEFSADVSNMDLSLVAEGPVPIKKRSSSFVAGFRQSAIPLFDIINRRYRELLGAPPVFTDFSFKLTSRNKSGAKTVLWGMAGKSVLDLPANTGVNAMPQDIFAQTLTASSGLSHQFFIGKKVNVKAVLGISFLKTDNGMYSDWYDHQLIDRSKSVGAGISSDIKLNKKNVLREGISVRFMDLNLKENTFIWTAHNSYMIQKNVGTVNAFTEWRHDFSPGLSVTSGAHYFMFLLNRRYRIEPRISILYSLKKYNFGIALGEYSRQNPVPLYLARSMDDNDRAFFPNQNLDFIKSRQAVFSFSGELFGNINFKTELYCQQHYDVATAKQSYHTYDDVEKLYLFSSALNLSYYAEDINQINIAYDNTGKAYSRGVEGTVYFDDIRGFSMNISGSFLESKYYCRKGWYNTLFNNSFALKAFVGKKFRLNSRTALRADLAMNWIGGRRYTPVDCDLSYSYYYIYDQRNIEFDYSRYLEKRYPDYFRLDFKTSLIVDLKSTTHIFSIDVRNLTDHKNIYYMNTYFENGRIVNNTVNQLQIIPVVSYKLLFGGRP